MSAPTWIDASTVLPDDDILVLIALDDGEVWPAVRDNDRWIYVSGAEVTETVTHWMHLPAAPARGAAC
ncbi:DUF551 domain-containing protein [Massilia oculi]|uniref:DUF551 domain-containing protein n=1 Tax=Massilia oculi TaxID=945844 RepID=UPI001AAFC975